MAVIEEDLSNSDEDYGLGADIFMTVCNEPDAQGEFWCASAVEDTISQEHDCLLALSDTCCARSVAGEAWACAPT